MTYGEAEERVMKNFHHLICPPDELDPCQVMLTVLPPDAKGPTAEGHLIDGYFRKLTNASVVLEVFRDTGLTPFTDAQGNNVIERNESTIIINLKFVKSILSTKY